MFSSFHFISSHVSIRGTDFISSPFTSSHLISTHLICFNHKLIHTFIFPVMNSILTHTYIYLYICIYSIFVCIYVCIWPWVNIHALLNPKSLINACSFHQISNNRFDPSRQSKKEGFNPRPDPPFPLVNFLCIKYVYSQRSSNHGIPPLDLTCLGHGFSIQASKYTLFPLHFARFSHHFPTVSHEDFHLSWWVSLLNRPPTRHLVLLHLLGDAQRALPMTRLPRGGFLTSKTMGKPWLSPGKMGDFMGIKWDAGYFATSQLS